MTILQPELSPAGSTERLTDDAITADTPPIVGEGNEQVLETAAGVIASNFPEWYVEYSTPKSEYRYNHAVDESEKPAEKITITKPDVFDDSSQQHSSIPVTDITITVERASLNEAGQCKTSIEFGRGSATIRSARLVHYCGPSEALEWAVRLRALTDATPEGWIFTTPSGGELLAWVTADGGTRIKVIQQDRDCLEDRAYSIYVTSPETRTRVGSTPSPEIKNITTGELAETIMETLENTV